jgi:thiol-disulfide isomerase/thioredoxin
MKRLNGELPMPVRAVIASLAITCFGLALTGCGRPATPVAAGGSAAKMAPDFALTDVDGHVVHLSDVKGTVRLVDFWTTWCAPCREEIPMFKDLSSAYGPKGFTMVGIAMDEEGITVVKPFVERNGISYLTLVGNDDVAKSYGPLVGFPTKFLVDRDGRIVESFVGPVPRTVLEKKIQALL